ncbi:MAG: hypothetical protein ACKPKO_37780, partial [Candidatus Fonsibacter sp.]
TPGNHGGSSRVLRAVSPYKYDKKYQSNCACAWLAENGFWGIPRAWLIGMPRQGWLAGGLQQWIYFKLLPRLEVSLADRG